MSDMHHRPSRKRGHLVILTAIATLLIRQYVTQWMALFDVTNLRDDSSTELDWFGGPTRFDRLLRSHPLNNQDEGVASVYDSPLAKDPSLTDNLLVQQGDRIYLRGQWDMSPIVLEDYKLVFFTTAKVACTVWKQLFRRMSNFSNWQAENTGSKLPWNPEANGLTYLYHYNRSMANHFMTSPEYTRAIFVRDPKERFLSAYLDKVVQNPYFTNKQCCPFKHNCIWNTSSLSDFLGLVQTCENAHWAPQHRRMELKHWKQINFIGHMENAATDAKRLLQMIGAWEEFGQSGWGHDGLQSLFGGARPRENTNDTGTRHATNAHARLRLYYNSPELEHRVDAYYAGDYALDLLHLKRQRIFTREALMNETVATQ